MNFWNEPKETVVEFVKEHKLKQTMLMEGRDAGNLYGVYSVPTLLWLDKKGIVRDVEIGFHGPEHLKRKTIKLLTDSG